MNPSCGFSEAFGLEEQVIIGKLAGLEVPACVTCRTGVTVGFHHATGNRRGQRHGRGSVIDGKLPTVAGDVPVELIMVGEETNLTRGLISDLINVFAWREHRAFASNDDALAVVKTLDMKGLRTSIAHYAHHVEGDVVVLTLVIFVVSREVPIDAVDYLLA